MKLKKHHKYIVTWVDIKHDDRWTDIDEVDMELPLCEYIGFFVKEDKEALMFSSGITEDQYYSLDLFPRGCIKKIVKIKDTM